jgi:CubicO group peptidase (beta-lactamase class C family)
MESGLNVRAIDFVRFGLIFLNQGTWNGQQILPSEWVAESTAPLRPDPRVWELFSDFAAKGGYYSYHWWGLNNSDGSFDFMARGQYDQTIYIAPRKEVVIVRMGERLDEAMDWPQALRAIVDAL